MLDRFVTSHESEEEVKDDRVEGESDAKCTSCESQNSDDAKFCSQCGTPLLG
ncbi:MAG: zinc-ribbon domain-containing protein [Marmoricola sp.]